MTPHPPLKLVDSVQAINWNRIQDDKDLEVWNRPVSYTHLTLPTILLV